MYKSNKVLKRFTLKQLFFTFSLKVLNYNFLLICSKTHFFFFFFAIFSKYFLGRNFDLGVEKESKWERELNFMYNPCSKQDDCPETIFRHFKLISCNKKFSVWMPRHALRQRFPTFFCSRTPLQKKNKTFVPPSMH